jgi:hypothetical protein
VVPPVEQCVQHVTDPGSPRNGITEQLDIRLDPATAGFVHGPPGGSAEVRAWVRSASGREPDPLMLLTIADALPPVTFDLGISGWVPTIELTAHVRAGAVARVAALRAAGAAAARRLARRGVRGRGQRRRLVVQARQLAAFREPTA